MGRIAVHRDGHQMAVQIGPDWVMGMAGFGDTVVDAVRELADWFAKHDYERRIILPASRLPAIRDLNLNAPITH